MGSWQSAFYSIDSQIKSTPINLGIMPKLPVDSPPNIPPKLQDFRDFLPDLPSADSACATKALEFAGKFEYSAEDTQKTIWMSSAQSRFPARLNHPRLAIFASHYHHSSDQERQSVEAAIADLVSMRGSTPALCEKLDCDLRVYEMNLQSPAGDAAYGALQTPESCALSMAYGMMAVESGVECLIVRAIGAGAAAAMQSLRQLCFGDGHGLNAPALRSLDKFRAQNPRADFLDCLAFAGGREIAAVVGAILAARMAKIPVIVDGYDAACAVSGLANLRPNILGHCLAVVGSPAQSCQLHGQFGQISVSLGDESAFTVLSFLQSVAQQQKSALLAGVQ